MNVEALIR